MAADEVFGPYSFSLPAGPEGQSRDVARAALYSVWIFGPQDDTLPAVFSLLDGDRLIRATRRLVIASADFPVRLVVTWGSDDTPALMFEGLYRCPEEARPTLLAELRTIFDTRPRLGGAAGAQPLDGLADDEFRERVVRAIRETVRGTAALSQKAVARALGTNERALREECDFRSRRGPHLRWATLKLDALPRRT